MLLREQQEALAEIPEDAIAHVHSFDERTREVAMRLVEDLKVAVPNSEVLHLGATKIGIAGENDIDIGVIVHEDFDVAKRTISSFFGEPIQSDQTAKFARWTGSRDEHPVDLFLCAEITPRIQEFIDTQSVLEARGDLRSAFERLKFSFDGKSMKEYTKSKFEFFNSTVHPHGDPVALR